MSFIAELERHPWDGVAATIAAQRPADVERALARPGRRDLDDFLALVSPAAAPYLEAMARLSQHLTIQRFGRTIQFYVPLYLSNWCANRCRYCGFSAANDQARRALDEAEIMAEAEALARWGFQHLLLVTGEAGERAGLPYLRGALDLLRPRFANLSLEVQPLETDEYADLVAHGLFAVLVYQETYHPGIYQEMHPAGPKRDYRRRLATPERLGEAGVHKIGLGCLLGLADWRVDAAHAARHLAWLERRYWRSRFSMSFPRLRDHTGRMSVPCPISDRDLVQLICAYRLFDPELELVLSTRESARLRDHAVGLGITTMSAGSRTSPGGYRAPTAALEQFAVADERSPAEVAAMIRSRGYEPVWKDWDPAYDGAGKG